MPKIVKLSTKAQKMLLEAELQELHQEEQQQSKGFSGRKLPKYSSLEGVDRQELYDKYGHC